MILHKNNIDSLRAIAILSVMAHHINAYAKFNIPFFGEFGGLIGVQLFFLISGYLIIKSAESSSIKTFITHRIFRIFPAYLFTILSLLIARIIFLDGYLSEFIELKIYFLLNLLNLQQFSVPSLILLDQIHVGWSLTVELIWYGIAVSLATLFYKYKLKNGMWIWLLIFTCILSLVWVFAARAGKLDFLFEQQLKDHGIPLTPQSIWHLVNGNIIGHLYFFVLGVVLRKYERELIKINSSVLWIGAFVFVWLIEFWQNIIGVMPQPVSAIGLACLMILFLKCNYLNDFGLNFVGKISYSLYLVHSPVLVIFFLYFKFDGILPLFICISLIFTIATLVFYFIERPMIDFGRKITLENKSSLDKMDPIGNPQFGRRGNRV